MNIFDAISRIAIKNHMESETNTSAFIEKCYRHYSKTYSTPLYLAKELVTMYEVVLIYMEDQLEGLSKEEIEELYDKHFGKQDGPTLQPDRKEEVADLTDDEWVAQMNAKLQEEEKKEEQKKHLEELKRAEEIKKAADQMVGAITSLFDKANQSSEITFDTEEQIDGNNKED